MVDINGVSETNSGKILSGLIFGLVCRLTGSEQKWGNWMDGHQIYIWLFGFAFCYSIYIEYILTDQTPHWREDLARIQFRPRVVSSWFRGPHCLLRELYLTRPHWGWGWALLTINKLSSPERYSWVTVIQFTFRSCEVVCVRFRAFVKELKRRT